MQKKKNELGQWAEQCALTFLQTHQCEYISRNYHSRYGEIDLIVKRKNEL